MLTLLISANNPRTPAFGTNNVKRTASLMQRLTGMNAGLIEMVIGKYNGNTEISVRVSNCVLSVAQIKSIMAEYSQDTAMVVWDKAGVAELIGSKDYSKSLRVEKQKSDVLPDMNGTFVPSTLEYMVAK